MFKSQVWYDVSNKFANTKTNLPIIYFKWKCRQYHNTVLWGITLSFRTSIIPKPFFKIKQIAGT